MEYLLAGAVAGTLAVLIISLIGLVVTREEKPSDYLCKLEKGFDIQNKKLEEAYIAINAMAVEGNKKKRLKLLDKTMTKDD